MLEEVLAAAIPLIKEAIDAIEKARAGNTDAAKAQLAAAISAAQVAITGDQAALDAAEKAALDNLNEAPPATVSGTPSK